MKKKLSVFLAMTMLVAGLAACRQGDSDGTTNGTTQKPGETTEKPDDTDGTTTDPGTDAEIVDGRFVETRKITVEIYDRGNEGGSTPEDNMYTDFIKEGLLRDHNIEVEFVPVPRWTEVDDMNNLLAANDAPDVSVTYSYPTIQTYANYGGILDLSEPLEAYKDMIPNLWGWLEDGNIYWNRDPEAGTIWAIEARLAHDTRINTFVREDWLDALDIDAPATLEEFEAMLYAFRDNADTLLGAEAAQMVPFSVSYDVGWRSDHLHSMFMPTDMTEYERYIYGFDDRHFLFPGYKEGIAKLNAWYNEGLMWNDFALYGSGDETEDNMMKAGFVGAFQHNWDYPYRNGDNSINNTLKRLTNNDDAGYITIEPFQNADGVYRKFLPGPVDRKVFFPATNDEPLASLLYLDWISRDENRTYLQIGDEGVTHEVEADGAIRTLPATGDAIMNSPLNIDYTITINGLNLGDPDLTIRSLALGYPGVDADVIKTAYEMSINDGWIGRNVNVGAIAAEEGMGPSLSEKRDIVLAQAVTADPSNFDSVFDSGMDDYLSSGGQAIINERIAAWEKTFGQATEMP